MNTLAALALAALGKLIDLVAARANKPIATPAPKFNHGTVTDAQVDALFNKKDLH